MAVLVGTGSRAVGLVFIAGYPVMLVALFLSE